jgi:hypothetical protein
MKRAFFWLLLLSSFASLSFALANLGDTCKFSGECREGYCLEGVCRFPQVLEKVDIDGNCTYTAECKGGFCKEGMCVTPTREEFQIVSFGVKSGCAGIIENCTGIFCAFCDVSWILLLVGAVIAAFVGRKRGRLVPFVLFALPFLVGLIIFPILGFILALIEIFILAVTKKALIAEFSEPPLQG